VWQSGKHPIADFCAKSEILAPSHKLHHAYLRRLVWSNKPVNLHGNLNCGDAALAARRYVI
jgi:hypothetical protein